MSIGLGAATGSDRGRRSQEVQDSRAAPRPDRIGNLPSKGLQHKDASSGVRRDGRGGAGAARAARRPTPALLATARDETARSLLRRLVLEMY